MCNRHTRSRMQRTARQPARTVLILAAIAACGATASAQTTRPAGLNEAGITVVRSVDEGPLRAAVRREVARLVQGSTQAPKQGNWMGRHPVMVGTLIGTGVGAGLAQIEAIGGVNQDPTVALIGAGAGAWGGLIASAVQKVRSGEKVGVGTKIGIVAGAVALTVLPVLACYGAGGCGGSS